MSLTSLKIPLLSEEDEVDYNLVENLSYDDMDGEENILLFNNGDILGYVKVWEDSEMNKRNYIILNYTIIYLDTLKKI